MNECLDVAAALAVEFDPWTYRNTHCFTHPLKITHTYTYIEKCNRPEVGRRKPIKDATMVNARIAAKKKKTHIVTLTKKKKIHKLNKIKNFKQLKNS